MVQVRRFYFRTRRTWLTRFSMTPSNASFSLISPSRRFSQNSKTELARRVTCSSSETCWVNSPSVNPSSAASVVAHSRRTDERSSWGGGVAPRRVPLGRAGACPVVDVSSPSLRGWDCEALLFPELSMSIDGRMSFFCLDAGKISSRSTGTPRETRKSRRMRDFTQF